jgi:hypothetical protein
MTWIGAKIAIEERSGGRWIDDWSIEEKGLSGSGGGGGGGGD